MNLDDLPVAEFAFPWTRVKVTNRSRSGGQGTKSSGARMAGLVESFR
jgi:hypothetical protein